MNERVKSSRFRVRWQAGTLAYKDTLEIPAKLGRVRQALIYVLVAILCAAGLAAAHGSKIEGNWHVAQWEDAMFFRYNSDQIHSVGECFEKKEEHGKVYIGRLPRISTTM